MFWADLGAAAATDESHVSAESGETGVQLPGAQEKRWWKYNHKIPAEKEDYKVHHLHLHKS